MQSAELPILALLLPYSLHHRVRNISYRLRQADGSPLSRWRKDAAGNQALFLFGKTLHLARHNARYRLVPVAHEDLLASAHSPDVGTELGL
jgi:hypothetical protein